MNVSHLKERWPLVVVALVITVLTIVALSFVLPPGIDWTESYRPAARELLSGRSPYNVPGFVFPTWAVLPMLPLGVLPDNIGRAVWFVMSLAAFGYTAYRLGARPLAMLAFLASPPVLHCLLNANIDWLAILGFAFPPQIGLFFIVMKPQMGVAVVVYWLVEAWRDGGVKEVVRVFWPVTVAMLATFVIFGLWPLAFTERVTYWWNASLWPSSIPVGLTLLVVAVKKRDMRYSMGASPCLSPYVLLHSWSGALAALVASNLETVVAVIGLWIVIIIRAFEMGVI